MNLTSQQVHWMFGAAIVAAALLLILREAEWLKGRWMDLATPAILLAFGVELLLDPLVHGSNAPANYAQETAQHFILGLLLIATGVAEIVRVRRGGEGWKWRLPLASALMVGAGIFAFHAQHDSNVPMILLQAQHRVIAATLALASLAFLLAPLGAGGRVPSAFSALLLLLGLEFLLYTEGEFLFGAPMPAHEMQGH
jgi:hypothetical protein